MSDEIKINRTSSQSVPRSEASKIMPTENEIQTAPSSKLPWIILGVVVLVLILFGVLFRDRLFGSRTGGAMMSTTASTVAGESSGYQAVFLTNGQVYFGKLTDADSDYPTLTDIYYLQVVQPPLQGQQSAAQAPSTTTAQPSISLVKLGNELHGPVDLMHIAKAQILFYEDMKSDSQVVKAIQAYKANPSNGSIPTPSK